MVNWMPGFPVLGGVQIGVILALGWAVWQMALLAWMARGREEGFPWEAWVYSGLGILWQGLWAVAIWEGVPSLVRFTAWNLAGWVVCLLPLGALLWISRFLERPLPWWAILLMGLAAGMALGAAVLPYRPETGRPLYAWWNAARLPGDPALWSWGIREGLWGIGTAVGLRWLGWAYVHIRRPLHRNRIAYGWLGAGLVALGEGLTWTPRGDWIALGWGIRGIGITILGLPMGWLELPSLRQAGRSLLAWGLSLTLQIGLVFGILAGAAALRTFLPGAVSGGLEWGGMALAIVLAQRLIGWPLHRWLRRRLLPSVDEPATVVRRYSQAISNLLDMETLAQAAFTVLQETFGLRRGFLMLFEERPDASLETRVIPGLGEVPGDPRRFAPDSPILRAWQEGRSLTQYEIDFGKAFRQADPEERRWLQRLGVELFVPIRAQAVLLGCLALGARGETEAYGLADQDLLASIAEQTAAVLQNIRLVEDPRRLNARLAELNEDLARAARRLEKLDRAKTHFIEIASHELRTPLTHIRGYTDLLTETLCAQDGSGGSLEHILQGLRRSALRLEEIINVMLDVSQIDAEALSIYPISIQIPTLVRMAVEPLEGAIAERRQKLIVQPMEDLPLIYGDLTRLVQALRHVVQNAIKFTPDGGTITLRARRIPAEEAGGSTDYVEIAVQDTGIGIDPEDQALIFEKFYRVGPIERHSTGSVKFKGAGPGLGLPLARGIIEAHGGRIWVESPGYDEVRCPGSTFYIWLPVVSRDED
jgi:signal transduction histidine kinase